MDIIKKDVKPSVLDHGQEIILANWPNTIYVICDDNHNFKSSICFIEKNSLM